MEGPSFGPRLASAFVRGVLAGLVSTITLVSSGTLNAQSRHYALESTAGIRLVDAAAEPVVLQGKRGLRVVPSEEARMQLESIRRAAQAGNANTLRALRTQGPSPMVLIEGIDDFTDGTIEAEIAGAPAPDAAPAARGFVGVAFRMQNNPSTFESIYLRPTNGRAQDQERRNHSVQYAAHPDWAFDRLRKEAPSKYETYVDLQPGVWTKIRIEVRGAHARLYVHGREQPTFIVNDLKLGDKAKGGIALTLDIETVAHFRNLKVEAWTK